MPSRKPAPGPLLLRLTLAALTVLLASCATSSPPLSPEPVQPPQIPALPQEARQPAPTSLCSPTCSARWRQLVEQWQQKLTGEEQPAPPASGSSTD